jgi:hypothetical protein
MQKGQKRQKECVRDKYFHMVGWKRIIFRGEREKKYDFLTDTNIPVTDYPMLSKARPVQLSQSKNVQNARSFKT